MAAGRRKTPRRLAARRTRKRKNSLAWPGPSQCHPRLGKIQKSQGCFPEFVLKDAMNRLGIGAEGQRPSQMIKKLTENLGIDLQTALGNQKTFLEKLPFSVAERQKLAKEFLRPPMPAGWKEDPDMWLDSNNIRGVMKQYEEADPKFKFLGPFPIDFAAPDPYEKDGSCLIDEICDLNLKKEHIQGKDKIGIVFNLDPHTKGGSHWIATYIDIPKKACYYFDSYGMRPPKQIYRFMQWLGVQEPTIRLGWNGRRFQMSDTECGMYCLYFLERMIAGEPYLKFCRRAPPDQFMLDLRDWFFST